jgi:UDP-N-acetyl-D-glucosamine dehydrogenase
VGGHCIPIDPFYLTWKAREYDFHTRFIELAAEINLHMPYYVVQKVTRAINENKKSLKGSQIFLLGMAYKKDISDARESPAVKVLELLLKEGSHVQYHDAYIPKVKLHSAGLAPEMRSVSLTEDFLHNADCVVILTDHSHVDYRWVADNCKLIVDARNATRGINRSRAKIVKL